jgi:hypothetical protein
MRGGAGRVGYPHEKNLKLATCPALHGLDKIQPESAKKH